MARTNASASVAARVRQYVDAHASIRDCLGDGLINLSALARQIMQETGLDKPEAVLVACRRYRAPDRRHSERTIRRTLGKSRVEVTSRMAIVTFRNDWQIYGRLQNILRRALERGHVPKVIQGSQALTLITDETTSQEATEEFGADRIVDSRLGLVELAVASPQMIRTTPGIMAYLCRALADRGINVLETMSTYTDTIFVVAPEDMMRAFEVLSQAVEG